jgi:hypothetical protein
MIDTTARIQTITSSVSQKAEFCHANLIRRLLYHNAAGGKVQPHPFFPRQNKRLKAQKSVAKKTTPARTVVGRFSASEPSPQVTTDGETHTYHESWTGNMKPNPEPSTTNDNDN